MGYPSFFADRAEDDNERRQKMSTNRIPQKSLWAAVLLAMVLALTGSAHALQYTVTDLGNLSGALSSHATDINNSGQIVGYSSFGSYNRAWLYNSGDPSPSLISLGTLGGTDSAAWGINEPGHITGTAYTGGPNNYNRRAFLWTPEGGMQDLGTAGLYNSYGQHINDSDWVAAGLQTKAGVWKNGAWTLYNPLSGDSHIGAVGVIYPDIAGGMSSGIYRIFQPMI
jgi:probable HAF family extracellular repeat protein